MKISQFFLTVFELCLFRYRVVDLPYSVTWIFFVLILDMLLSFLLLSQESLALDGGFILWGLYHSLLATVFYFILAYQQQKNRFMKGWLALLDVHLFFNILSFVLYRVGLLTSMPLCPLLVGLWSFSVNVAILQQILDVSRWKALLWAIFLALGTTWPLSLAVQWLELR